MKTAIAVTLLIASITSGLSISRQIHGYRATRVVYFALAALVATGMMLWFAYAAVWEYRFG